MKVGDLVKVIKNDMSLVIKSPGPKDNKFFNQVGIVIKVHDPEKGYEADNPRYGVLFPAGYYDARRDALELIRESW